LESAATLPVPVWIAPSAVRSAFAARRISAKLQRQIKP
jgi:hypothetical protein